MLTIFHASSAFRHANTQVLPLVPAADPCVTGNRHVTFAVSALRAISQERNANRVHLLLYAWVNREMACRINSSSATEARAGARAGASGVWRSAPDVATGPVAGVGGDAIGVSRRGTVVGVSRRDDVIGVSRRDDAALAIVVGTVC